MLTGHSGKSWLLAPLSGVEGRGGGRETEGRNAADFLF